MLIRLLLGNAIPIMLIELYERYDAAPQCGIFVIFADAQGNKTSMSLFEGGINKIIIVWLGPRCGGEQN